MSFTTKKYDPNKQQMDQAPPTPWYCKQNIQH